MTRIFKMFDRITALIVVIFFNYAIQTTIRNETIKLEVSETDSSFTTSQNVIVDDEEFYFGKKYLIQILDELDRKLKEVRDICEKAKCTVTAVKVKEDDGEPKLPFNDICKRIVGMSKPVMCKSLEREAPKETDLPKNCQEIYNKGTKETGIYKIQPSNEIESFHVLCEMENKGGGWTAVQNRMDNSENFNRRWIDYEHGFGVLTGEFWLGLIKIHHITKAERTQVLFELVDMEKNEGHAIYNDIKVGDRNTGYILQSIGNYTGTVGDSLFQQLHMKFSTRDLDQDANPGACANYLQSGFWFNDCFDANPNGYYPNINYTNRFLYKGVNWKLWRHWTNLAGAKMFFKPI